jgi:hypothetical protein
MADTIITCQNCGSAIPVSEFVDINLLVCMKCKAKAVAGTEVAAPDILVKPTASRLRRAVEKPPEPPPQPVAPPEGRKKSKSFGKPTPLNDVRQYLPKAKKHAQKRRATVFEVKVLPWLLFAILTAILCWLRFTPGALPSDVLDTFTSAGVLALYFFHITIICYAFGDDSFYGILCLIIPGYSLYYLFIQADQMILRSVMAALMVAFGWDAVIATQHFWREVYETVSLWIATTDTVKKK